MHCLKTLITSYAYSFGIYVEAIQLLLYSHKLVVRVYNMHGITIAKIFTKTMYPNVSQCKTPLLQKPQPS